ncbi:alpha/beta hydrolase [Maribacter cobaltidurans]|uniref:Alpha/beta hydrolase n=1 Tax=Maribacter cobaltidurans TaxID=1178778 RepID=A0A223V208_9FLAO|nr:alpha/beta hydrolase [Maribacter cobaltidurans]ASV29150.1 alpha/beta hydrolase [Maribacter cobaltidurans]
MKKFLPLIFLVLSMTSFSQQLKIAKGAINDSLLVKGELGESFSLYLPTSFSMSRTWPVLFIFDMKGNSRAAISMFTAAAEEEGYILASSNEIRDTLSLSQNVLIANRMLNTVYDMVPIHKERSYVGGIGDGGRFATLLPTFIKDIRGVLSCGAAIANTEVLTRKNPFYFIGIAGRSDYNYRELLESKIVLDNLKFPNLLIFFEGEHQWASKQEIVRALRSFTLFEMAKGNVPKNDSLVKDYYESSLVKANELLSNDKPLLAENVLDNAIEVYNPFGDWDSLKTSKKILRRSKTYRTNKRLQNNSFLKESLTKEDYGYYLEEDVLTYNYNNLGWWNYQMSELDKMDKSSNEFEKRMSSRLRGFLNALISDNINIISTDKQVDLEALNFLNQLKTITDPKNPENYLKVISYSSQVEDYGTAIFYLEELLKTGYDNKEELYNLDHTALFRITPEFNAMIAKYLKDARYDLIEEN